MSMFAEMRQGWGAITGRSAAGPSRLWCLREHLSGPGVVLWSVAAPVTVAAAVAVLAAVVGG